MRIRILNTNKTIFLLIATAVLAGCATQSAPQLATTETFEAVACEDLVKFKYDREVKLLTLSAKLQRVRNAAPRGSSGDDGWSKLGDSFANLGHTLRLNEIANELTTVRVEITAIEYHLTNRCQHQSAHNASPESPTDAPTDPD